METPDTSPEPDAKNAQTERCPTCHGAGKVTWTETKDDGGMGLLISAVSPAAGLLHEVGRERTTKTAPCSQCGGDGLLSVAEEGQYLDQQNRQGMIFLAVAFALLLVAFGVMVAVDGLDAFSKSM
jgi:hypothetical protein